MTHPIDLLLAGSNKTLGSDYWVAFDEAFMNVCSEIVVLQADGWQESRGVQREISFFLEKNRPVKFLALSDLG
jgi:hypothetical protein